MKYSIQKIILFTICLIGFFQMNAQVGDTGAPLADVEINEVCEDNGGILRSLNQVIIHIIGEPTPTILGYFDGAGNAVTPTGTIIAGYCSNQLDTIDFEYELLEMCDTGDTTSFFRLIQIVDDGSNTTVATLGDYNFTGAVYTLVGTAEIGFCSVTSEIITGDRTTATGAGALANTSGYLSYEIVNLSIQSGTVTVGGNTHDLIPGESFRCAAEWNFADQEYNVCPTLTYDATGTTFRVVSRVNN